jgi:hypothetical protein
MKRGKISRIAPELYDFLKYRSQKFNTGIVEESRNLMAINEEISRRFGIDFPNMIVDRRRMPKLNTKKKVVIFGDLQ